MADRIVVELDLSYVSTSRIRSVMVFDYMGRLCCILLDLVAKFERRGVIIEWFP